MRRPFAIALVIGSGFLSVVTLLTDWRDAFVPSVLLLAGLYWARHPEGGRGEQDPAQERRNGRVSALITGALVLAVGVDFVTDPNWGGGVILATLAVGGTINLVGNWLHARRRRSTSSVDSGRQDRPLTRS